MKIRKLTTLTLDNFYQKPNPSKNDFIRLAYSKIDEKFILQYLDKLDWKKISRLTKLSEDFIRMFHDKVDWQCIKKYQKLSTEFKRDFYTKF
jgi:hypothetical protein